MIKIFGVKIVDEDQYNKKKDVLLTYLPESKKDRIARFAGYKDAQRTLLGDLMVRSVICETSGVKNCDIKFGYLKHDKPFLKNPGNMYFNISHSGDWVVCAFSEKEIGIDVEKIRKIKFSIADRFFSPLECKYLHNKKGEDKVNYFFDLWTIKESYLKLVGKGLTQSLSSFSVEKCNETFNINIKKTKIDVNIKQYDIGQGYKLSICAYEGKFAETIKIRSVEDCINSLK